MTSTANDPAEARKRRREIIQFQRSDFAAAAPATATPATAATNVAIRNESLLAAPPAESAIPAAAAHPPEKNHPKKRKADADAEDDGGGSKKKTQIRYDPDVPMSKEQLAAWRREARRVRNRESAAASRQRIRNRISELEDEVGEWKDKYAAAMQRLQVLQRSVAADAPGGDV